MGHSITPTHSNLGHSITHTHNNLKHSITHTHTQETQTSHIPFKTGFQLNTTSSRIIVTAFVTTSVVFVSFSLTALYAERRSMLFLGSLLSTALSGLLILSLANMFFRVPSIALVSFTAHTHLLLYIIKILLVLYVHEAIKLFFGFVCHESWLFDNISSHCK